jgi:hypothetical protein
METKINPILMVENEPWEITDLEEIIDTIAFKMGVGIRLREYASSAEDAVEEMKRRMKNEGRYSAIITDNHLDSEYGDCLDGDEFLQMITGNALYALSSDVRDLKVSFPNIADFKELLDISGRPEEDKVYQFLEEYFRNFESYKKFVDYWFGKNSPELPIIMLCGSPREANLEGLEGRVDVIQKQSQRAKKGRIDLCEKAVIRVLVSKGVFPYSLAESSIEEHPRLSSSVHPNQREYRIRKKL